MKIILKRIISFVLTVAIVLGMVPSLALNTFASEDTVYISVSYDEKYIQNKNGEYMANVPVKLSDIAAINLDNYELSEYKYDEDGDGINEITALHLIIYAHENLYGGKWSDVSFTGDPGSSYFAGGIFGFDENLNYFHNGEFPIDEKLTESNGYVTGATSDRIVLTAGDHLDIAGFTSYDFYQDSNFGFHKFADMEGNFTDNYKTVAGETTTVKLVRSYSAWGSEKIICEEVGYPIYYGSSYGNVDGEVTTGDSGCATIIFPSAGTYYIWCDGGFGLEFPDSIVSTPAYAMVNVEGSEELVPESNHAPILKNEFNSDTGNVNLKLGEEYSIKLSDVFEDADGDLLTYSLNDTKLADLADGIYRYTPTKDGIETLIFKANDGQAESAAYTITLTVEKAKEKAKLESLVIYQTKSLSTAHFSNVETYLNTSGKTTTLKKHVFFDPDSTDYELPVDKNVLDINDKTMQFYAKPENEEYSVMLFYDGVTDGVDIKKSGDFSTKNTCKIEDFLKVGINEFQIVVSSEDKSIESTTYNFKISMLPTLLKVSNITATVESIYPVYQKSDLTRNKETEILVPDVLKELTINTKAKYEGECTVTYDGKTDNVVDISGKNNDDTIDVVVSKDGLTSTYKYKLKRVQEQYVVINVSPSDADIKVNVTYKGAAKNYNLSKVVNAIDGKYPLIFNDNNIQYTYEIKKEGYSPASGTITESDDIIDIILTKDIPEQPKEVTDVDWKNFRNSDVNMAITSVKTPSGKIALKWNTKLGDGWGSAPSVPIIVGNDIVVMSGKKLLKLSAETGEVINSADMVESPNFGYTPATYANGMIFCPLSNGTVQAFNATNLDSLWVYKNASGGQALSPITFSDGYIYTGFWNGEHNDADYVCIDTIDYDINNQEEPKSAVWSHKQAGGFYWAGSVVVGDSLIVGTDDGGAEGTFSKSYLYSFDKKSGEIISKIELTNAGDQRSSIAYDNGKIYFTTKGGYLYSATVSTDGKIENVSRKYYDAQITSTPIVYNGKVYFGIGSGISTSGSTGSFVVADANSLEKIFEIKMKGYPQGSALLSTAYEETGWLYFYNTYNNLPGGISLLKIKTDAKVSTDAELIEIYDAVGFEQYSIASIVCDEDGTLYYKNDSANLLAVAPATAKTVIQLIDSIGTVTLKSEASIKAAREAYDALSKSEKLKVTNYNVLVAAEKTYDVLIQIDEVKKLIDAIGNVTMYSNLKIEAARSAYEKLSKEQQALVTNYEKLITAEKKYEELVDEAVDKVKDLIDAIGEVTLESAEDITAARRAYNQLPPHVQKLVSNLDKLEKAEKELAELREEALELIRNGKLMLTKSELLKLQDEFENVTAETKYDDALKLLLTYFKLGEKQQLALAGSEKLELLKTIVAKQNHENPSTGITMYGLEWNIKVKTDKLPEKDEHIKDDIISKLEGAQMLTIWDIYLEDVLTGERYKLDEVAEVCIPVELVGDYTFYDRLGVVHYGDDGKIEVLNCRVVDGYVVFKAVDFSYYAVVGFIDDEEESEMTTGSVVVETPEYEELIEKADIMDETNSSWLVWVGTAGVGIVLLAVLLVLKRRMSNEA